MKDWCKIIELDTHDVVVERFYDEEEGECVRIMAQDEIGMFITTVSFETPEQALEFYNKVNKDVAQNVVNNLINQKEDDPLEATQPGPTDIIEG